MLQESLKLSVCLADRWMASRAPIVIQNENLPIFRGIDGKKVGAAHGPAARAGRQERKALGDLSKARKAPPASTGGKATAAASVGEPKNVMKPSYLSDEDWMKCCSWAKDGVETASFMGNDTQKLLSDKQEERIRKKVEKAMGTMQLYMENLYDIDVYSEVSEVDPEDKAKLDLDPEFLLPMPHLSSRLGEQETRYLLSDLEFERETFANFNLDLKLKDDYGNDSSSRI
ncbi:hypothetical protein GUJ93_ZPchr0001g32462 [Zizania palustris]|uniref:Uncharacterized protein n=1 Tax=Zizania palustris TaxID=103762 RepID=A0A8J5R978_ZIZPA|nr:hypothetical protein GUJ93_ZPchr0001g32462 [Zizania palustris]